MDRKLLIVDGHNLAFRAYYALKNSPSGLIKNHDGVPITICSTFPKSIDKLIRIHNPTHLAIAFDRSEKTFRDGLYPDYKANRDKDRYDDDLKIDIRNLKALLKLKNISYFSAAGYEADDIIATIVNNTRYSVKQTIICSSDKDLLQLVSNEHKVFVYHDLGVRTKLYNESLVLEDYGVSSAKFCDFKALIGDKSDNIPGVKGIGQISASYLLKHYESVADIISNLDEIKVDFRNKIQNQIRELKLSRSLVELRLVPSDCFQWKLSDCDIKSHNNSINWLEKELGV